MSLQLGNLLLRHGIDSGSHGFHVLAELLTHGAEVTLHLLHQDAGTLDELHLLDVHLLQENLLDALDGFALSLVNRRNHQRLQRLLHLDALLAAQGEHDGRDALSNSHAALQFSVDGRTIGHRELV